MVPGFWFCIDCWGILPERIYWLIFEEVRLLFRCWVYCCGDSGPDAPGAIVDAPNYTHGSFWFLLPWSWLMDCVLAAEMSKSTTWSLIRVPCSPTFEPSLVVAAVCCYEAACWDFMMSALLAETLPMCWLGAWWPWGVWLDGWWDFSFCWPSG